MLEHLSIKDLAVIEALSLELNSGFTAVSGETGAGKSIILNALNMVLGERCNADFVRYGSDKAEVTASFSINDDTRNWLQSHDLITDEDDCIIRRIIASNGRSKAYINDTPVPVKTLQGLGEKLVDIHGQHAHQSLLKINHQRELLDRFSQLSKPKSDVKNAYQIWHTSSKELEALKSNLQNKQERADYLEFQLNEFEDIAPQTNEFETLEAQHKELANAENILQTLHKATEQLNHEEQGLISQTQSLLYTLSQSSEQHPSLQSNAELIQNALIQFEEAEHDLRHALDRIEMNPEQLSEVEERLSELHQLARKHHIEPSALCEKQAELQSELDSLNTADADLVALEQRLQTEADTYHSAAKKLSEQRHKAAQTLSKRITQKLAELSLTGHFEVNIESDSSLFNQDGYDRVEFFVSTNPGQPAKPLAKVASGGELSRISLAIQVATAEVSQIPTLIFDEVDVGIGGATAEVVGHMLKDLGQYCQILTVTHQAQVAALGHQHLNVRKTQTDNNTTTEVCPLNAEERIEEIARMMGGIEMTQATLQRAKEMLAQ